VRAEVLATSDAAPAVIDAGRNSVKTADRARQRAGSRGNLTMSEPVLGGTTASTIVDVSEMIETQRIGPFAWGLLFWTGLCMLLDGFDFGGISYVIPRLAEEWHVPRSEFGSVLGVGVFGIMIGSIIFGYVGDRIGRKRAMLIGCWWFGAFIFASVWAQNVTQLVVLRFLAGMGLYAAVPNAIVLINEFAPSRLKATWVVLMFTGFTLGNVAAGLVAASLIPAYGWQIMFVLGGLLPLPLAVVLIFSLPESVRFLTEHEHRWHELAAVLRKMHPGVTIPAHARFTIHEKRQRNFTYNLLFAGPLLLITPLLWLFYIANSMATFFTSGWLPSLMQTAGFSPRDAALTAALNSVGATIGGLFAGVIMDKLGLKAVALFPLAGALISFVIGYPMPIAALEILVFAQGFFVIGAQFACTALGPMFYPTSYRADGEGTALAVAKIGSIAGPVIGGIVIGMHLPLYQQFYVAAVPLLVSAIAAFYLGVVARNSMPVRVTSLGKDMGLRPIPRQEALPPGPPAKG
jgi:AAHS family 4-hydroxybenzoate transporter-like MFS transporter